MARFPGRREQLRTSVVSAKVDAILVSSETNVSYLTGFTGDSSVLVVGRERDVIVSDGRYTTQLSQECPELEACIRSPGDDLHAVIAGLLCKLGLRRVAFEETSVTVADYDRLRLGAANVNFVGARGWVEELRQIKDDGEIAAIREAILFAELAFDELCHDLRRDDSEKDVADALENRMRRRGATAASFPISVAVGIRAALPHARPTADTKIGQDDFVLIDWGATGRPYKSDLTRVLVTGKVTPKFEAIYRIVLAAQERGIAAIRPGVEAHDVDAEARSIIEEAGFGRFFDHGLGHGLGMDIHEAPRVRRHSKVKLKAGMVVTVEPGIYLPDWGGIRIEDDVLVTPDGCEVLTHVPKSLDAVRIEL